MFMIKCDELHIHEFMFPIKLSPVRFPSSSLEVVDLIFNPLANSKRTHGTSFVDRYSVIQQFPVHGVSGQSDDDSSISVCVCIMYATVNKQTQTKMSGVIHVQDTVTVSIFLEGKIWCLMTSNQHKSVVEQTCTVRCRGGDEKNAFVQTKKNQHPASNLMFHVDHVRKVTVADK